MLETMVWTAAGFLSGALPFSVWVGSLSGSDIRQAGDGNPGAANVFRANGIWLGILALLLDFLKGLTPVLLARLISQLDGFDLVPAAVAPVFGHAFSPFLRFRGGKALAVTFGIWSGMLLHQAPLALGLGMTIGYGILSSSGWQILPGLAALLLYLLFTGAPLPLFTVLGINSLILIWKHRQGFSQSPQFRIRSRTSRVIENT